VSKKSILSMAQTAILLSIVILMAFTPLGYLRIGALTITFVSIPVVIGGMVVGPISGLILGTAFGITSFVQAFLGDAFASTLFTLSPVRYFLMCVPTRMLMGLFSALIFKGLKKLGGKTWYFFATGLIGAFLNTLFFMSALVLFFFESELIQGYYNTIGAKSILSFVVIFVGINGVVEMIVCSIVGGGVAKVVSRLIKKTSDGEYV